MRITTRTEAGCAAIEATGAECWIGTPDRIGTLREALAGVTVMCWLLGNVSGGEVERGALHGPRLQMMLSQVIDTTIRGLVYEAAGSVEPGLLGHGAELVREAAERSAIPYAVLTADTADRDAWVRAATAVIAGLLGEDPLGKAAPERVGAADRLPSK